MKGWGKYMNLCDLVTIKENNAKEVILEVKPFCGLGLKNLGVFSGKETTIKVTKGPKNSISLKEKNMTVLWVSEGDDKHMTDKAREIARLVKECVVYDFGIHIGNDVSKIEKTRHYHSIEDHVKQHCEVSIRYFEGNNPYVMLYKDGEFVKNFYDLGLAMKFLKEQFVILSSRTGITPSNGVVETFKCLSNWE